LPASRVSAVFTIGCVMRDGISSFTCAGAAIAWMSAGAKKRIATTTVRNQGRGIKAVKQKVQ
jgi:hypothetical protein